MNRNFLNEYHECQKIGLKLKWHDGVRILEPTKLVKDSVSYFFFVPLRINGLQNLRFLQSSCSNRKFGKEKFAYKEYFLQRIEVIDGKRIFIKTISCHENNFFFFVGSNCSWNCFYDPFIVAIIYILGLAMQGRCFIKCLVTNWCKKVCLIHYCHF